MFSSWFTRSLVVVMLVLTLASGDALADRGGRGHGGGGGGGGGRSSFSGGGGGNRGGGGGGGRSFSGGGGGGGRSFSGGGGSSMSRSFSPQGRSSFSGGGGGGGGGSSMRQSFSPQSRPSFGGGGGGGDGGSAMRRSFSPQPRSSFSGGGGGGGDSSLRSLRSTNRGSFEGNSSIGRSLGNVQSLGGSSDNRRSNFRPSTRNSFQGLSSGGDAANDGSSSAGSQLGQRRNDSVNRANWTEGWNGISSGGGVERRLRAGGDATADLSNQGNRGGDAGGLGNGNNSGRRNGGKSGSPTLAQQLEGGPSNDGFGSRTGFRRGQIVGQEGTGRPTDDQLRNFLNLSKSNVGQTNNQDNATAGGGDANRFRSGLRRGGEGGGGSGDSSSSIAERLLRDRDGGSGDGNALGNRFGRRNGDVQGKGTAGDVGKKIVGGDNGPGGSNAGGPNLGGGGRGDRGNRGDGKFGDGKFADGKFGDGKFGDGKWRDGQGGGKWRGGELGKGDHRDWSGRWKDGKRFDVADHIRGDWNGRNWKNHHDVPFHGDWWKGRNRFGHHHWDHWNFWATWYHRPYFWWGWTTAPLLTNWCGFTWGVPYYWDYGPGEYIYCNNGVIYVNGRWFEPAPLYYEQTLALAQRAPELPPEQALQVEWLPLGVFAVSRDGVVDKNLLVQLAVTKDGVIGGTVLNQTTGATFDITGMVDKQSQRAVWAYKDETGREIAMETSVYNLTQPEATAMIHYGPTDMQVVELVRLEEPKTDTNGAAVNVAKPQAEAAPPAPPTGPAGTLPAPEPAPLPAPPEPTNPPMTPEEK